MKTRFPLFAAIMISLVTVFVGLSSGQNDEVKAKLFKEADELLAKANAAQADILAPKNFDKAWDLYAEASSDYDKGKNLDEIRKKLSGAIFLFREATKATDLAKVTFSKTLDVRSDALTVESHKHSPEKWVDAEKKFREAAIKLEEGNVKDAQKKADESIPIYREAELDAIKDAYLSDALTLIKKAKEMDVSDEAPRTLQNAEDLVKQAEQELSQNRYDTDRPRSLAQQAKYQAGHSIYLAGKIREMKDNDKKYEDLFLMAEEPLRSIAANFDIAAHFDEGLDKVGNQIDSSVTYLQDSLANMTRVLSDKEQEINNLNARVTELEGQLGDIAMEKTALTEKMEAQAKIRQNFNSVDKLFSEYEGRVLRQGDDIIIRLTGLSFDVGKAVIKPENFGLLTKVREAINIFPDARIVIQGHTDSYGSDDANFSLSQERADAVMAYLLANMNLEKSKIMAEGYGETVPIATNETPEGRAKNRRIDVVIKPVL